MKELSSYLSGRWTMNAHTDIWADIHTQTSTKFHTRHHTLMIYFKENNNESLNVIIVKDLQQIFLY